jgi:indole-3-glycerol phosphate synthase
MNDILKQILEKKRLDLIEQKKKVSEEKLWEEALSFEKNSLFLEVLSHPSRKDIAVIAEIKLASPTNPSLGLTDEILTRARAYAIGHADAISFITEKHFFKGDTKYITEMKHAVSLPVLQKDFIIDLYQIYEAKTLGSDALLLIARIIDGQTLKAFVSLCQKLGIEPVVEIHSEEDLVKAEAARPKIIAVNARDLETFSVDVSRACKILEEIPDTYFKLGFSGIHSSVEVKQYKKAGAKGVLIGTSVMKAKNVESFLESL